MTNTELETKWRRWRGKRAHWTFWKGCLAWQVYRLMPVYHLPYWTFGWLLPSVGDYCYWDEVTEHMNSEFETAAS